MASRGKAAPSDLKQRWFFDRNRMLLASLEAKFNCVVEDANFADSTELVSQYDSMVGNRTESGTFDDAAVLRLRDCGENAKKVVLSTDCNSRICWLSPREGGRRAVAEAAINLATKGAEPIGITDCLNFGSPENPEVMWQFEESIEGISEACEALNIPVVSGNVSFYNDTDGKPIYPTPMIGMVGLMEAKGASIPSAFFGTQLEIGLLGPLEGGLGGSVVTSQWFKRECGQPEDTDLRLVDRMVKLCAKLRQKRFSFALHDISDGGMVTALLEMAFRCKYEEIGMEILVPQETDVDRFLFGESVPRILCAYEPTERVEMEVVANSSGVSFTPLGTTNDLGSFVIVQGRSRILEKNVSQLKQVWKDKWKGLFH
jgi:phosphoribosylformylglycinamidine synthase